MSTCSSKVIDRYYVANRIKCMTHAPLQMLALDIPKHFGSSSYSPFRWSWAVSSFASIFWCQLEYTIRVSYLTCIALLPLQITGAGLTALVAGYILPYDWGPNLCMTFGAILAGTDPIAVAGLLNSSGAPERLKMHISGESLLNDGSVVVLYNIFSALFFYEIGIQGGEQFTVGEGFAYFFRLSLGGCAIGELL